MSVAVLSESAAKRKATDGSWALVPTTAATGTTGRHVHELLLPADVEAFLHLHAAFGDLARALVVEDWTAAAAAAARAERIHAAHAPAVSVSLAASLLGVSPPTIRGWTNAGLLTLSQISPRKLSLASIVSVRGQLNRLRATQGRHMRPTRKLLTGRTEALLSAALRDE